MHDKDFASVKWPFSWGKIYSHLQEENCLLVVVASLRTRVLTRILNFSLVVYELHESISGLVVQQWRSIGQHVLSMSAHSHEGAFGPYEYGYLCGEQEKLY